MTIASRRRRKAQPYNPNNPVHDRQAKDLLRNAKVVPVEVEDPYEPGAKILAIRSTRDDPIADMLARGHIDQCEFETARHWQRLYEGAEIGGARGIDPSKEAVDGGRMADVLTDRQVKATKELKRARDELGAAGNWLIVSVLGTKKTLELVAWEWRRAPPGSATYRYITRRFHECLQALSELFGYALPPRGRG